MPLNIHLELKRRTRPVRSTANAAAASIFGLDLNGGATATIVPPTDLELRAGELVYLTGPSGGGKSTLLHLIARQAAAQGAAVIATPDGDAEAGGSLVDRLVARLPFERALHVLSLAGLADAHVMLRTPRQLSDGQRSRFRLATAMASALALPPGRFGVLLLDEFCSTLDRVTAVHIASRLRRWVDADPTTRRLCVVVATAHDDLLESLRPDMVIEKDFGSQIQIARRDAAQDG